MSDFPQEKGREFCNQHVYVCQTQLVVDLAELEYSSRGDLAEEFSLSQNCINYNEPVGFDEWGFEECMKWLKENGVPEDEWPDEWSDWNDRWDEEPTVVQSEDFGDHADDDAWRECVRDHWKYPEVHSWYVVSDWFEYQLEGIGEVILRNAYGSWWGRQCGGQAIYMDKYLWPIFEKWFGED